MGATEASTTDKFATVPRFLLVMQCFTFIIRHLQILLWSKMWDLDFGGAGEPGAAAFVAQQMGQKGQKRGLKGGPPVLDAARAAYLGTEYSGPAERRPPVGRASKTDV